MTRSESPEDRPLLRFVARSAAVTESRAAPLRAALAARRRARGAAYAVWPSLETPLQIVPLHRPDVAAWARETFEPWTRRPGAAAFVWSVLRSRALLLVSEPGPLAPFAEAALGRGAGSMDALYVSMTGGRASKLLCFVFDHGARSPAAVAKVIPDPRFAQGLRHEVSVLAEVRERALPDDVAAALPLAPLAADTVDGDFIAVEPVDELARHTGAENRDTALRWLERFHRATRTEATAWDAGDTERLLASARYAWEQTRPQRAGALLAELERRSAGLHGSAVDRCTSHGDFWRGNIASWGGSLRVFDWEWAEHGATPFLDLWAYELAPLLNRSWDGGSELVDALARASDNVRTAIAARGLPEDFAAVTLAPMLAELAFRFRRDRGIAGGSEARFARMLPAVERLMEAGSPRAS